MCRRMQAGIDHGEPVDLHHAFPAVSVDVIPTLPLTGAMTS